MLFLLSMRAGHGLNMSASDDSCVSVWRGCEVDPWMLAAGVGIGLGNRLRNASSFPAYQWRIPGPFTRDRGADLLTPDARYARSGWLSPPSGPRHEKDTDCTRWRCCASFLEVVDESMLMKLQLGPPDDVDLNGKKMTRAEFLRMIWVTMAKRSQPSLFWIPQD